jgi:hypothetical protein
MPAPKKPSKPVAKAVESLPKKSSKNIGAVKGGATKKGINDDSV